MEKDESNAMMEVLDATKKLNLVENEPVKSKAVEREQEEVINENSTTDHRWNNLDNSTMQKETQETLKDSAGIFVQKRKSKKNRQYNDQAKKDKRTINDIQYTKQKTKDAAKI